MFTLGSHVHTIDTLRSFKMGAKKKVGAVNANFQTCLLRTGDKEACTPTFRSIALSTSPLPCLRSSAEPLLWGP